MKDDAHYRCTADIVLDIEKKPIFCTGGDIFPAFCELDVTVGIELFTIERIDDYENESAL